MEKYKLGEMERRFAELIWDRAPVPSGELVVLCSEEFGWKKSTTYTMLRRLCQRGIFVNECGSVSEKISRAEFIKGESTEFVNENFGGSLPAFVAAFASSRGLSNSEVRELYDLIGSYENKLESGGDPNE